MPLICCHSLHFFLFFVLSKCASVWFLLVWAEIIQTSCFACWLNVNQCRFCCVQLYLEWNYLQNISFIWHAPHIFISILSSANCSAEISRAPWFLSLCKWTVWFRLLDKLKLVRCSWCFQLLPCYYTRTWTHKLHLQKCSEFKSWALYYFSGEKLLSSCTQTET